MAEIAHEQVAANGIVLHVAIAGPRDGRPVVLCHGFPELWYSWRHQLAALGDAGYRVLAPDLRGYGGSSHPAEVADYGSDRLTADLCGLLDHYGYQMAAFAGHDWGSAVVWEMGRLHPDRVECICNMSVPYTQAPAPPTDIFRHLFGDRFFYVLYFQEVGPAESEFDADPRRFVRTMLYAASGAAVADADIGRALGAPAQGTRFLDVLTPPPDQLPPWITERDVDVYTEGLCRGGLFGPLSFYRNIDPNWERSRNIPASVYAMPTGFITGSLDPVNLMTPDAAKEMAAALPDFRGVTVIEGAGHWVQQEQPDDTNAALLTFLEAALPRS